MIRFAYDRRIKFNAAVLAAAICFSAVSAAAAVPAMAVTAAGPGAVYKQAGNEHLADNTLEWYEIDDLISVYNAVVLKNRNELSKDERRSDNSSQISTYLLNKADDMETLADQMSDTNAVQAASYRGQAESLRLQAESNVVDFNVIKLEYEKIEKETAESARTQFLNYYKSGAEKVYKDSDLAYKERLLNSAQTKRNVGLASDIDVLTAMENRDKAKADVLTADTNITSYRNGVLVLCGWAYGSDGVIAALPEMNPAELSAVNYEQDKNTAMANNYTLRIDQIKMDNATRYFGSNVVEENQRQFNNDKSQFETGFESKYNSLINSCTAYTNAVNDKALGAQNLATAEKQLGLGVISAVECEGIRNNYNALVYAEQKAYIDMIAAKSAYDAAVAGVL